MNRYVLDLPVFSVLAVLHFYDDGATSCADRILITELGLRLTDRGVWSQTAHDIQPDVIQYYLLPVAPTNSSRWYHRSTIGCPLGARYTHWFLVPAAKNARGMSNLTQDGVYFYGDRVYQLGCSTVPRSHGSGAARLASLSASMDATHLIFDKNTILPSGSQRWQLKILYDYSNCNFKALFKW